jgi:dihydrofolate synthase / folylpolyglutamate synthase
MPSATRPSTATDWVASLDPWPEEFGIDRMRALLAALGDPQRAFPSIHVVGTNGKSTATRTIAALLHAEGLKAGAYTSPHVSGWHERLDCDPATFERAVARVRGSAEPLGATQFEVLTAAALAEFAEDGVDVAGSTRRTSSTRLSSCSRTSRSSTPRCSATRRSRSRRRSWL